MERMELYATFWLIYVEEENAEGKQLTGLAYWGVPGTGAVHFFLLPVWPPFDASPSLNVAITFWADSFNTFNAAAGF